MKWIQKANIKKGALSRQLGIPIKKNIPLKKLDKIIRSPVGRRISTDGKKITVTKLLKRRAVLAKNLKRMK